MVEIQLDGQKVEVPEGSTVMHAAEKAGTYIPHFCYHKKLSIAANCRMCLVDVEKAPKPMPACATPVTQGMIVHTKSDKAIKAQKGVMEFLLINHPLDCPICDQGGECQLQDLAVGYGGSGSRYEEEKRVVFHKNVGPLISMEEMSRCIHCTRCVRFGQEVAGVMELGMSNRGEHAEIETFVGMSVDSELSGNMIDICPVGALTSKPFRYSARTWELSRRKSVSPHDSTGANLIVQVKSNKVMRVVPLENEDVNECWIADRDRFSYEALNSDERLTTPMLKQGGQWKAVDWQTALEYVANGLKQIKADHGAQSMGLLASPHSTLEELYLAASLMRGLGSDNIDYRLRNAEFAPAPSVRWLGTSVASLSQLQRALVIGSNLRKDHPLFAQRIRQSVRKGCALSAITSVAELASADAWAMPVAHNVLAEPGAWAQALADVAAAIAADKNVPAPAAGQVTDAARAIAKSLQGGERKAILLGNAAAHHAHAESLLALANWIGTQTGASVGYLTEAANTVGAQLAGVMPSARGLNAGQMLTGGLKAVLLLNNEPEFDSAAGASAGTSLIAAQMVVTLSPFKANMAFSDVLLPIAPFSETPGTFVNAEGRVQGFHAVTKPLGETRPAWKVLRVLANLLELPGFDFESAQDVLKQVPAAAAAQVPAEYLGNSTQAGIDLSAAGPSPVVASIYQLDGMVRRATSLQLTADARQALAGEGAAA
ncbi:MULTISPECIES: NADH-quinone oxidoreductase subunit NuoG [unclassified Polaromonas]|jgi:NADH-quinone oxidoreductase subunit G|uniref:NADH-quinone oxidoreductase subunit NuoG n=1 Tax=unclassified Polaromonas TaxID=2638319 RepID=UPI000BCAD403|nr:MULTISPECIES: NADH-quinone oxidoreductase subunit NuoG [unclassified Polaromonas]OYY35330.1 MAG: NADH-quinone oxidoreductase subunit G [Polaromonas sp. 35-63-35]OYZ19064.1 MAG: NADH-quinone oxidoreductase subunit G [Polaromonas sp. 16-63-31]OYZ78162.1 MAG: NADH-quinone oxidoreductase subunit G [Polaromonas sp. 24-63-21]OZA48721.1 MAG: NADH-quinone oxidoreductase subunit G [Polaromonas sp. 17-63-33]OZA87607.1 MAG: NADH-quinone oxidoreductase subunit G [Polaromonas sp. 39-63-25]